MTATTQRRKGEHVQITLERDVAYKAGAGLDAVRFSHNALPDMDIGSIDTSCTFLGKRLKSPFMITGMTGGYPKAEEINRDLAEAAQEAGIAFGLGSQRAMIEDPALLRTYDVRPVAPDVFLCGNIGAVQLMQYVKGNQFSKVESAMSKIDADALCIHLNALQECVQPEGDRGWSGVPKAISTACEKLPIPVIAKETGAGISGAVARKLEQLGVAAIDVSGSGGTSWSAVELERDSDEGKLSEFREWGIPTATALSECRSAVKIPLIASGGLRSGLDVAKTIRLGAALGGAAHPFIAAQDAKGKGGVSALISKWQRSLRTAMFLTSCRNLAELSKAALQEN